MLAWQMTQIGGSDSGLAAIPTIAPVSAPALGAGSAPALGAGAPALLTVAVASGTGDRRAAPETGGGGASVGAAGIDAAGSGVAAVTGTPPGEIEIDETAAAALGTGAGDATTAPWGTGGNLGGTPFANALRTFPDTGAARGL